MIEDLFNAIMADLPTGTKMFLGEEHLQVNDAPPRIVWVPSVDQFGAPVSGRDGSGNPRRSVYTAAEGCVLHIWGRTYSEAIGLRDELINACKREASANFKVHGGSWLGRDKADWLKLGRVYLLTITIDVPILQDETFALLATINDDVSTMT